MIRSALAAMPVLGLLAALCLPGDAGEPTRRARVTIRDEQPRVELVDLPIDPKQRIHYQFSQPRMTMGFMVEADGRGLQNITCSPDGSTHNTICRIDNADIQFGLPPGNFDPQQVPLEPGAGGRKRQGTRTTWITNNLHFTQIVEVVASKQVGKAAAGAKRQCDTCLIRYVIENKDARAHTVGIRNMIDTLVAGNDGALFAIPTKQEVLNMGDFRGKEIPAYVQVMERPDLQNPGLVAYITPKVGGRLDAPDRLSLTRWPGSGVGWEVPVGPGNGDTAYAIYWDPKEIKPGGKREVGFGYGKGLAPAAEDEGRLDVALGGSFEPERLFTVTGYVENPIPGQSLTLELPAGMVRVEGNTIQPVPQPDNGAISVVVWKGRVLRPGEHALRVRSSTGVTLTKTITVTAP